MPNSPRRVKHIIEPQYVIEFVVAYVFEGEGTFGADGDSRGESVPAVRLAVFDDGDHGRVRAGKETRVRCMRVAGAPFREPIFPYGPFVMNTQEEIRQALMDRNCSASVARRLTHSLRSGRFAESRATTAKPTRFAVG